MRGSFGFRVKFVMNTTEIDDKIILKARRLHLLPPHAVARRHRSDEFMNAVVGWEGKLNNFFLKKLGPLETFSSQNCRARRPRHRSLSVARRPRRRLYIILLVSGHTLSCNPGLITPRTDSEID
jgi:cysteinyl-tRNA synthetase